MDEAILVTLLKNTHLKHGERKLHVLLFAFGSECSTSFSLPGAKVPHGNVGTKVPVTVFNHHTRCIFHAIF